MESIQLQDWRFHLGDCPDAWQKGFDDAAWQNVVVPHDWAVEFPFSKENASGTGYLPGGIGWYRCEFTLKPEDQGKHIEIAFDGAYKNSQVWCNGYYLGKRPSGFAPFTYDISPFICCGEGEVNRVCVRIAHEDIADARWYTGSGLCRPVVVNAYEETYIPPESVIFTSMLTCTDAAVSVACEVRGACEQTSVSAILVDEDGRRHSLARQLVEASAGNTAKSWFSSVIAGARIWSPDAPHEMFSEIKRIHARQEDVVGACQAIASVLHPSLPEDGESGLLVSRLAQFETISQFETVLSKLVFALFYLGMLVPTFVTEIARFKVIQGLGLYNTLYAPIVIYVASDLMQLYIYRQFISRISVSLDESALIDGCGYFRIFGRIIFPLLAPATATLLIIKSVNIINDMYIPYLYMPKNKLKTLTTFLMNYANSQQGSWQKLAAAIVVVMVPTLIIYIFFQKYIFDGISAGAVKE